MEYKQMLFDACSSHSEPRLLQLAALKDPEISKSIAQNVFITEAVSIEIWVSSIPSLCKTCLPVTIG
jgi:hypothetical protein